MIEPKRLTWEQVNSFRIESLVGERCPSCGFYIEDHTLSEVTGCRISGRNLAVTLTRAEVIENLHCLLVAPKRICTNGHMVTTSASNLGSLASVEVCMAGFTEDGKVDFRLEPHHRCGAPLHQWSWVLDEDGGDTPVLETLERAIELLGSKD